jgi:hypothetical protein
MERSVLKPDLVKTTEIFLIPSSFLVAALGTADTNFHRAAVSAIGLIISILWWFCSREAFAELVSSVNANNGTHCTRTRILYWLPIVFVIGWLVSTIGHGLLWNRPLGVGLIK